MRILRISMPSVRWVLEPTTCDTVQTHRSILERVSYGTLVGLGMFALARFATLVVAWVAMAARPELGLTEILTDWDGNWNEIAAADLYAPFAQDAPESILRWRTLAFFPVLPLVTRAVHELTGIGIHVLGPLVSMMCGAAAFGALGKYLVERIGRDAALVALALMVFSPNAFVLSMFYTEGVLILCVVATMRNLDEQRWWRAGLFAALGGLTRPSGFVLIAPCVAAAISHVRAHRTWGSAIAPILAPLGLGVWVLYVAIRTGHLTGYFQIQSEAWGARIDGGRRFVSETWSLVSAVGYDLDTRVSVGAVLVVGVGGLVLAHRQRMPVTWMALAGALVVLTIVNERQASGARFLLPAFPLFVAWARAIPRPMVPIAVGASATAMGALFLVSTTFGIYTP